MEAKNELFETFKNMSYGENKEHTTDGAEWLQLLEISNQYHTVEELLKNQKTTTYKIDRHHIIEFVKEIKNKSNIITQIEILARGILSEDTKKSVNILIQYLNYYSNFIKTKDDNTTLKGTHVAVLDDKSPLWILGIVIAPSLAAKNRIILQTGLKFAVILKFILEIAKKVGIPEDFLVLMSSGDDIDIQSYFNNEHVSIITLCTDLLSEHYKCINNVYNKKILVLSSYKSCSIIFDDADLDSSVDSIISATWGNQGTLPWSIDTVIVQENIFKKVVDKLKQRLQKIKVDKGNDKNADISYPKVYLQDHIQKAKSLGIEVYQCHTTENTFQPTLIIGSKVSTNNVIEAPENTGALTLIPFRFIDEAINLANNSRQGLGISIWAEKIGLINEVARKLKVNNVWVNSHGLFSPEIPLTPYKDSGVGCFSSELGFLEYSDNVIKKISSSNEQSTFSNDEKIKNIVKSAKLAVNFWCKKSLLERRLIFKQLQGAIKLEHLEEAFDEGFNNVPQFGVYTIDGYNVASLKEPRGVIVIEFRKATYCQSFKILIAGLLEGNAIIILNEVPELGEVFEIFHKELPKGILSVFPYTLDAVNTCALDQRIDGYFSTERNMVFGSLPLVQSKLFGLTVDDWRDSFRKTILVKNVWTNIGESFQCNI
ncbi:hypothetical protein GWI33_014725 [Rhynchophorus ferrugineus]|uniref:Aldehyde dehydrogenase domain-containing protein n=1 Tax=Rhynchophorus ferrugineus TaxID=354439 RepID=A0A834M6L9_RHYFE|nr:hypothetical protein GWI33_014725 [Rhynchophorus ferrugineus]